MTSRSLRRVSPEAPSFDLVVATVERVDELARLLDSLAAQSYEALRILVVDQNDDDRLSPILHRSDLDLVRVVSPRGLARARNAALPALRADIVGFADDDCTYPPSLLRAVAWRLAPGSPLDGISLRVSHPDGRSDVSWPVEPGVLTKANVWTRVASAGLFLRRSLVERVGVFDEQLGLGSAQPWSSGEETDYVIRALEVGAKLAYEPELAVHHALAPTQGSGLQNRGRREGASVGYLLRKHRYPATTVARMAVRPIGGAGIALLRGDLGGARFQAETLRGRVRGYFGARSANNAA